MNKISYTHTMGCAAALTVGAWGKYGKRIGCKYREIALGGRKGYILEDIRRQFPAFGFLSFAERDFFDKFQA